MSTKGRKSARARPKSNHSNLKTIAKFTAEHIAGPLGGRVLSTAAGYMSRIMGQGAYTVRKNTLLTNSGPPSFSTNGDDVIIKHRELVTDLISGPTLVSSASTFNNINYLINPGNGALFPWLSQLATSFEEYEFHGLVFEFKSASATAVSSTNTALGIVMFATDYNCENALFSSKRAMETTEFSTSCVPSQSMIHPIECDPQRNVLGRQYVTSQTSTTSVPGDPRMYFTGNLQIATQGMQAASVDLGEIWVSYQVRLSRPTFTGLSIDTAISPSKHPFVHASLAINSFTGYPYISSDGVGEAEAIISGQPVSYGSGAQPWVGMLLSNHYTGPSSGAFVWPVGYYTVQFKWSWDAQTGVGTYPLFTNTPTYGTDYVGAFGSQTLITYPATALTNDGLGAVNYSVPGAIPIISDTNVLYEHDSSTGSGSALWSADFFITEGNLATINAASAQPVLYVYPPQFPYIYNPGTFDPFMCCDVRICWNNTRQAPFFDPSTVNLPLPAITAPRVRQSEKDEIDSSPIHVAVPDVKPVSTPVCAPPAVIYPNWLSRPVQPPSV
jgi:hypothetical protein